MRLIKIVFISKDIFDYFLLQLTASQKTSSVNLRYYHQVWGIFNFY